MTDTTDADRQWRLNLLKEGTTAAIAMSVIMTYLYTAAIAKIDSPALVNIAVLIIGFYFGNKSASANFARRQHRATDDAPRVPIPTPASDREPQ